jgi:hypothetical protein
MTMIRLAVAFTILMVGLASGGTASAKGQSTATVQLAAQLHRPIHKPLHLPLHRPLHKGPKHVGPAKGTHL